MPLLRVQKVRICRDSSRRIFVTFFSPGKKQVETKVLLSTSSLVCNSRNGGEVAGREAATFIGMMIKEKHPGPFKEINEVDAMLLTGDLRINVIFLVGVGMSIEDAHISFKL